MTVRRPEPLRAAKDPKVNSPATYDPRRFHNKPILRLTAFVMAALLLSSCAGMRGGAPPPQKFSDGLVEMIRQEYQLDTIDQNQFIVYKGTIKNWIDQDVYNITADFVGFNSSSVPIIDFHENLVTKLKPGEEYSFRIVKHMAGAGLDRINAKVTYLREKPSLLGGSSAS